MIKTVAFMPYRDARTLVPSSNAALIVIHEAGSAFDGSINANGWGYYSSIGIDDAAYDIDQIKSHGTEFNEYYEGCATKVEALKILVMIKMIKENPNIDDLIITCKEGRSLSAAVAKFVASSNRLELDGDTTHANSLLYRLLSNPYYFDEALETYVTPPKEKVTTKKKPKRSLFPLGWIDVLIEKIIG